MSCFDDVDALLDRWTESNRTLHRKLMEAIGDVVLVLVEDGFTHERSPDGVSWVPWAVPGTKPAPGQTQILTRTAELRANFNQYVAGLTLHIRNPLPYASFHQTGTDRMPARPMLPVGSLSPEWHRRIAETSTETLHQVFE